MCETAGDVEGVGDLADLRLAVERWRSRPHDGLPAGRLRQEMLGLRRLIDLLELDFSSLVASFATADEIEWQGHVSPIAWVRHECKVSTSVAVNACHVGEQAARLPRSTGAMVDGEIGFGHLALMATTMEALTSSATATPADEVILLCQARQHSVSRFRKDCEHARHAADLQRFLADQVEQVLARTLELTPCPGGAVVLRGFLDAEGGATVRTALEPLARPGGADDDRSRERRLADALVELAGHGLDSGVVPQRAGQRPHLQVTATVETLQGLPGSPAGELELAGTIAAATVQRLGCDASISRVLFDSGSAVVDVGRARRLPAGATRRALQARDRGCVWPGCERPASWTQAHHIVHWAHGGSTDLANLVLICGRHHWQVHEGGWRIVRTEEAVVTIPPLPRAWPPAVPPHPSPPPPPPPTSPPPRARAPDGAAA